MAEKTPGGESKRPRKAPSLNKKFTPAPLENTLGSNPENADKIAQIRAVASQQESEAKALGPNYKPEKSLISNAVDLQTTEAGDISYTPSDLSRKFAMRNTQAQQTGAVVPTRTFRGRRDAAFNSAFGTSGSVESQEVSFAPRQVASKINIVPEQKDTRTGEIIPASVQRGEPVMSKEVYAIPGRRVSTPYSTPQQVANRTELSRLRAADAEEQTNTMAIGVAKQVHRQAFPGVPWPGMTAHKQMMSDRQAKIDADNSSYEAMRPKPVIKPAEESIPAQPSKPTVKATPVTGTITYPADPANTIYIDNTNHPLYKHGRKLYDAYATGGNKESRWRKGDTEKSNWTRDTLKNKIIPALYPDKEDAAYKDIMSQPDKIVDVFKEYHDKQKAFAAAHKKGLVPSVTLTDANGNPKLDKNGDPVQRRLLQVHQINKKIRALKTKVGNISYVDLSDPEEEKRSREESIRATQDTTNPLLGGLGNTEGYNSDTEGPSLDTKTIR